MFIVLVGLNHRTTPVEIRERLSIPESFHEEALKNLKRFPGIEGCIILSTCNRLEIYATVRDIQTGFKSIKSFLNQAWTRPGPPTATEPMEPHLYTYSCQEAIGHLFRVAAGLDSMVIGESQILGQVREAYEMALQAKVTNGVMNTLFQQAIVVGKRVRTETGIGNHAVSIGYTAVELAKQLLTDIEGHSVLIVGAGEIGELTVRHLVACGASSVMVSNRSYDRAMQLAEEFGGTARRFDDLQHSLAEADIVICCTAACHYVLHHRQVELAMEERKQRPLMIIDIAVPRDVDPMVGSVSGVYLYDIDDLESVVDSNLNERKAEAVKAEAIINQEFEKFGDWLETLSLIPTIVALKDKAERIKQAELTRARNRLGSLSSREEMIISSMANSIVNRLMYDPVQELKARAKSYQGHLYAKVLQSLFRLELEEAEESCHSRPNEEVMEP
ncbi:MAG: glutamyl-tRNA reductase [Firmicutes bacterium]|nr:glutamyl-tRNA reductase [Bacillota bacterium]